jgi:ABC-type bacteriocin/lantibiotic exporter with double-glycine peptidase domain
MSAETLSGKTDAGTPDFVTGMMEVLRGAGRKSFDRKGIWEGCLCALVLSLEPRCRIYRILEALPWRKGRMDQMDALNTMAHLGYHARRIPVRLKHIDSRLLPCLFVSRSGLPAVILEEKEGCLRIFSKGVIHTVPRNRVREVIGHGWLFDKYDENRAATSKFVREGTGYSWFRALLERFSGTLGQVLVAGFMLNVIALATPLYIMLVYDRVIAAGAPEILPMLAAGAGLSIAFEWMFRRIRSSGLSWLATRMDNIVGNRIFQHLINLPPSLIERASVASQVARIKTFEAVRDFFCGSVFLSMIEMPFVILSALAVYVIAGPLVLVPLSMILVYALLFYVVLKKVRVAIRLAAKASSARQQFVIETFEKIKGVRSYGLTSVWQSKFRDLSGREMMAQFHLNWLGMVGETCAHALTIIAAVATVGFGVHFIWAGAMSTGALVATMVLVWRILTPFYSLCTMIPRLEQLRNSIAQVNNLMELDTEAMEARTAARLPKMQGRVTFLNTGLRYGEEDDFVFEGLSFDAAPGSMVVVTGDNGSGKTTLLKLVKGMYTAQHGSVQIDGFDIRQLDAQDLRRQISYVPQQTDFFEGTIRENLKTGNPLATDQDIRKAMQLADAWNDVQKYPQGLDTIIGRYGEFVPAPGAATRLSLARAYLHTAPLLLIDELPNALLNSKTGENLREYLNQIKGTRTVIMATYRSDFADQADITVKLRLNQPPLVQLQRDENRPGKEAA